MSPPRGASIAPLRRKAKLVRDYVDAAVITDGQGAQVRMAGWAGAVALLSEGVEPVFLVQGRDRNRIAIQADLLGAAGLGVPNVIFQTGDHATAGDQPEAAESFDLDSLGAIRTAAIMKEEGRLLSGRPLSRPPRWLIGCVESATAGTPARVRRLRDKVDAGAQFVLTQYVFDLPRFREWMHRLRDEGLDRRVFVLPGIGPVLSPGALRFIESLGDVDIPETVKQRLRGVPEEQMAAEGMALAAETLQAIREEPGVAGAYLLTSNNEEVIGGLLARAGIQRTAGGA
jgi:methylenetetrahydrofolate reductase (NADPH)